ncbi:MAG: hypothetical protein Q7S98_01430 [Deltaproteobacteria bacterium]|nr:hypothetical protein [Deltaproteobacteria bacterium]
MKFSRQLLLLALLFCLACGGSSPQSTATPPSNNAPSNPSTPSGSDKPVTETISLTASDWDIVYNGYGSISFDETNGLTLEPKRSTSTGETHSALVLAKITERCPVKDFRLTITVTTEKQLRSPSPNPWEVFWVFFNYLPDGNFKKTNYFILKTNGIELGRAFDDVGQTFLFTGDKPTLTLSKKMELVLEKKGEHLEVLIDGISVLSYDGQTFPQALYDQAGSIGLYTEDARVTVQSVILTRLDSSCSS